MASQAALYVHAIAMLHERADGIARDLALHPEDGQLLDEQRALQRSLRVFRNRLRRTEGAGVVSSRAQS